MTWQYDQQSGDLSHDGATVATGYSGADDGKNNPLKEAVHCIGPIPRGRYTIESPVDTRTHGPYVLGLAPDPANEMYGRSAFGIHGDSIVHPGQASEGCIVAPRPIREQVWQSGDRGLEVV